MFQVKKEGSKQNILLSDFKNMFAIQISKVHFIGEASKVRKNLKVAAQR